MHFSEKQNPWLDRMTFRVTLSYLRTSWANAFGSKTGIAAFLKLIKNSWLVIDHQN